ncbi:hypothetical protein [Streptomyces sp. NBC_01565]|uniref:hypothetical protein n=1 Tax=Streptomyces sp. NBC_01565 TaxID=2975881 RepID=UPI002256B583|nr:hypothetical protein [Streptomyces sp. NBC_01565]MCX4540477.1 hypothetical protein [Streptomyces sp. NBC_01565]
MSIAVSLPSGPWYPKPVRDWRLVLEISPGDRTAAIDWEPHGHSVGGVTTFVIGAGGDLTRTQIAELAQRVEGSALVDRLVGDPLDWQAEQQLGELIVRYTDALI